MDTHNIPFCRERVKVYYQGFWEHKESRCQSGCQRGLVKNYKYCRDSWKWMQTAIIAKSR